MSKNRMYRVWINDHAYAEMRLIPSDQIVIPKDYQRCIRPDHVQEIVDNFNRAVLNPIKVSHRNGKYWVFDGSHSFTALKQINAGQGTFLVECRVYENLTYEEECVLFARQYGTVTKVPVRYEMNALIKGKNEPTLDLVEATKVGGFDLSINEKKDGTIWAIDKARNLFETFGSKLYIEALSLIKETWNGKQDSLSANMIGGVILFLDKFGDQYLRSRFVKKLALKDLKKLRAEARCNKAANQSADGAYAVVIAKTYNYGSGKGRLDDTQFWALGCKE